MDWADINKTLESFNNTLHTLNKQLRDLNNAILALKENNTKVEHEEKKVEKENATYMLVELEQEKCYDRSASWIENKFHVCSNADQMFFESIEEATEYVRNHLDKFPKKVYIQNMENGRIRKIKKAS